MVRHLLPSAREPVLGRARLGETTELFELSVTPATEVFGYAYRTRFSGLAVFEAEGRHKEVHFVRGGPVRVASRAREELLGQRLVADGALSEGDLSLALAMMPRYEGRLGDTLLALGLLTPVALFRALSLQARDRLGEVHEWPDGRAALYGELGLPARGFPIEVHPIEFLRDGLGRRAKVGLPLFAPPWSGARLGAEPWPRAATALPPPLETLRRRFLSPLSLDVFAGDGDVDSTEIALLLSLGALRWVA
jgi:serine/threonine-protein kinase